MTKKSFGKLVVMSSEILYEKDGKIYSYGEIATAKGSFDMSVLMSLRGLHDTYLVGWCCGTASFDISTLDVGLYHMGDNPKADELIGLCEDILDMAGLNVGLTQLTAREMIEHLDSCVDEFLAEFNEDAIPTITLTIGNSYCNLEWGAEDVDLISTMLTDYADIEEPCPYTLTLVFGNGNEEKRDFLTLEEAEDEMLSRKRSCADIMLATITEYGKVIYSFTR